ncbi:hypothetical protein B0H17DRAFT_1204534 [Mycena rosella]|uniref:Fungal calcium binding protein domain-containing protein n=1 Tax=Mycena rosella TaxID=1033263 RepID=A0AAD7GB38_MYCRO|nr:hypothetical protein B0H17DRAFT_1204534 [Mycena rosella]
MQFFIVALLAVLATGVAAAPAPTRSLVLRDDVCDVATCVLDLGPSVVSCASAAAQLGADVFSDAGCLLAAAKVGISFPPSCAGCAEQLGVTDAVNQAAATAAAGAESVGGDIEGAAESAGNAIEGGISSIGSALGGLFRRDE